MLTLLKRLSQQDQIAILEQAASRLQPALKRAFMEAIERLQDEASLTRIAALLEAGNFQAVADYLIDNLADNLNGAGVAVGSTVFAGELRRAYELGAGAGLKALPPAKATAAAFDPLAPRAVDIFRTYSAELVQGITATTREGIVTAISESASLGKGPRTQARLIRDMIGLTPQQARAVVNFRDQLEQRRNAPLDEFGAARGMRQADQRRLSATERAMVRRHLKEGYFTQDRIDAMVERYRKSLLNKRALDISTTESMRAATAGQHEAWRQAQEQGILDVGVRRKWLTARDERVRHTHAAIPGMNPDGVALDQPFQTPDGPLLFPRDPNGTAGNTVRCRCSVILVNP